VSQPFNLNVVNGVFWIYKIVKALITYEISVISIAGGITVRKNKRLWSIPLVFKSFRIIINFVKERNKVDRMAFRASSTVIIPVPWVGNMGFVVWGVDVLAVPAGGERHLDSDLVAFALGKAFAVGAVCAHAFVGYGTAGEVVGFDALAGGAGDHAEAWRESAEFVVVRARASPGFEVSGRVLKEILPGFCRTSKIPIVCTYK